VLFDFPVVNVQYPIVAENFPGMAESSRQHRLLSTIGTWKQLLYEKLQIR